MLHQHFKTPQTGGAIRSYYLARALVDHGHRVVVMTSTNEKVSKTKNIEGIEVHYLPIPYDNRFRFYARGWSFILYIFGTAARAGKFRNFDTCYAISAPLTVGICARWIKFRYGIPYIFEVGDLWPDAPIQMGFVRNYFFQRILFWLEKGTYEAAESIVALSSSIRSAIVEKIPGKEIHIVPNMADCEFYCPERKRPDLENKFHVQRKVVVSYIGATGVANGLDFFLECANAARKSSLPLHFILCGDGAMLDGLKVNAQRLGLQNLSFVDFVNREGVKEVMNITDVVFVCYKPVPILETGSPNKFFDGLASGKMIIVNFGGWIKEEVDENRCGIYVDPRKPVDFVRKITPFISEPKLLQQYQHAARVLGERKYSRKILSETFATLF